MNVMGMTFKEGHEFKIRIKPEDDCKYFSVDIGHDSKNIAMHFSVCFNNCGDINTIIFNSMSGGCWGEEQHEGLFPFTRGVECKLCINYNHRQFCVKLPDSNMVNFPNRLGDVLYKYLNIRGDARVVGILVK